MKSLSKNVVMTIIARLVTLFTGLIVQRRILVAYGSTLNGLTSSITQVMSYLVILEAGLGTASIQALYLPLSQKNWDKVSGIVTATGKEYRRIAFAFSLGLIGAAVLIPLAVAGQIEFALASALTLITGGSYIVSYIFGGKYKALLNADRKLYVLHIADSLSILLSCVLRVMALDAGYGIVAVQSINLLCVLCKNIGYVAFVKRKYNTINYSAKPDLKAVNKRWNVLVHNLAGLVVNHTDIIILTIFADLKLVSLYGVYNLVFAQLSTMVQSTFMQAPQSNFGHLFHEDRERFEKYYGIYETGFSILLFVVTTISLILIIPFVSLYTRGVNDINYIDPNLAILFALILLMNQIRIPSLITISVAGAFKETQNGAIIEAVINITVSLLLYFLTPLGLYGLLIGTVCSYVFRTSDVIAYVYRHLVNRSIYRLVRLLTVNAVTAAGLYVVFIMRLPVNTNSYIGWVLKAIVVSLIVTMTFGLVNYLFNKEDTKELFGFGISRIHALMH